MKKSIWQYAVALSIIPSALSYVVPSATAQTSIDEGQSHTKKKPNVIIVLVDDQGKGDLACYGNPWVKTPNIDKFYKQSIRLNNFHVSPLSAPTRGAIMTGRYPVRNGEWATFKGRDVINPQMPKMAQIFKDNGYNTAQFGKWHMGENYPSRPIDCGFDFSIHHNGGGVSELSDYWGNSYFDDTYLVNEQPKKFKGYCNDIWFDQTIKYIEKIKNEGKPFFIYLASNCLHTPLYVPEKWARPYHDKEGICYGTAEYYGMVANMDYNFGYLKKYLKDNDLEDNTVLIYMTDNGSASGTDGLRFGYNAGMRGKKTSKYDGGHTVPFLIRWPKGGLDENIKTGQDRNALLAHVDMIPTFADLFNLKLPEKSEFDGIDFTPVLYNGDEVADNERMVFIHNRQDYKHPEPVAHSCILYKQWRLVNGDELYDIDHDPGQKINVAKKNKKVVEKMLAENAEFMDLTKKFPTYINFVPQYIGSSRQKTTMLTIQHAIGDLAGIWESKQVASGYKSTNDTYSIMAVKTAKYRFSVRRWPKECPGTIWGVPAKNPKNMFEYNTIHPESVEFVLDGKTYHKTISADDIEVNFDINVKKGRHKISCDFIEPNATSQYKKYGAYYIYVQLYQPVSIIGQHRKIFLKKPQPFTINTSDLIIKNDASVPIKDLKLKVYPTTAYTLNGNVIKPSPSFVGFMYVPITLSYKGIESDKFYYRVVVRRDFVFSSIRLIVSPEGSDTNDGSYSKPLRTLKGALTLMREMRKTAADRPSGNFEILFRKGNYTQPMYVTASDDGTKYAHLILRPYNNEKVVLTSKINVDSDCKYVEIKGM